MMPVDPKNEQEWQAQDDLRTLVEAQRIRKDKDRMKRARAFKKKVEKAIEDTEI